MARWRTTVSIDAKAARGIGGVLVSSAATAASTVAVDWGSCPLTRSSAVSVLVAADPEWVPSGLLSRTSVGGVRTLAEEGARDKLEQILAHKK